MKGNIKKTVILIAAGAAALAAIIAVIVVFAPYGRGRKTDNPSSDGKKDDWDVSGNKGGGEIELSGAQYPESCTLYDEIILKEATLRYKGEGKKSRPVVFLPDGECLDAGSFKPEKPGIYEIVYAERFGGRLISKSVTVKCEGQKASGIRGEGSVRYGSHERARKTKGLVLSLKPGSVFLYNGVIDLKDNTKDGDLLTLFLTPLKKGAKDAAFFTVKLTDAYDAGNYVTVRVSATAASQKVSYVTAAAKGQLFSGHEYPAGKIRRGDTQGYVQKLDFYGMPETAVNEDLFRLAYDREENSLYGAPYGGYPGMICDFDDPEYFENPWKGFTTGEVFLSLYAGNYEQESANFVITGIDGLDLSLPSLSDGRAPSILIDCGEYKEALPAACRGMAYPIFKAKAYDPYFPGCELYTKVFYGYEGDARGQTDIKAGAFIPDKTGIYTIEYTAMDGAGNRAVKTLDITCTENPEKPVVSLEGEYPVSGTVGEEMSVSSASAHKGSGRPGITVKALSLKSGTETDIKDGKFIPLYDGEYEIIYTAADYLGRTGTASYKICVAPPLSPKIKETPLLPDYLTEGGEYRFPFLYADVYDCSGGVIQTECDIRTEDGDGVKTGSRYTPESSGQKVRVTYSLNGAVLFEKEIPVKKVRGDNGLDLSRFFETEGDVSLSPESEWIAMSAEKDGRAVFLNFLPADGFSFKFTMDPENCGFERAEVELEDALDESRSLAVSYINSDGKVYMAVKGDEKSRLEASESPGKNDLMFTYRADKNAVVTKNPDTGEEVPIALSGEPPFSSRFVKVSVGLFGVSGKSTLRLKNICDQYLTSINRDAVKPRIFVDEKMFAGAMEINGRFALKGGYAADVLDPKVDFTVTVKSPSGKDVFSESGEKLEDAKADRDYGFVLSECGYYSVVYVARDGSKNRRKLAYAINVSDEVPPEMRIKGKVPEKADAGSVITLPGADVSDNMPGTPVLYICCKTPDGVYMGVTDGKFTAEKKGVYTVKYVLTDGSGNTAVRSFDIEVK